MKTGLRYFIGFLCLGLAVISGIWIIAVGWLLFEWALDFKASRKANDRLDQAIKSASELGFKIRFIDSNMGEAMLDFETDDGRNISLKVNAFDSKSQNVGHLTYIKYSNTFTGECYSTNIRIDTLEATFQSILRELADDHYVELDHA